MSEVAAWADRLQKSLSEGTGARTIAIMGPNGVGKSYFLQQIATELKNRKQRHHLLKAQRPPPCSGRLDPAAWWCGDLYRSAR